MTKAELLRVLRPFTDDIEIFRYDQSNLTDEREPIEQVNYKVDKKGVGEITLI